MHDPYSSLKSLPEMFFAQVKLHPEEPFLWGKRGGVYVQRTWRKAEEEVLCLAGTLESCGVRPGDRVMLVAENRPEWAIADLAIMTLGAIAVPAYVTNTSTDHKFILEDAGVKVVLCAGSFVNMFKALKSDLQVLSLDALPQGQRIIFKSTLRRVDTACLIYTSGTGGTPKGVMLSHGAILSNCEGAYTCLQQFGLSHEVFLSFLPLAHSYEHTAGLFFPISIGAEIYYAEGLETLARNIKEARPTIMTAVPRLYEVFQQKIEGGLKKASPFKRMLFEKTLELGRKRYEDPKGLSFFERGLDFLLTKLVRAKVKENFGGRLKAFVSGGAALNYENGLFFTSLGLTILQGYGQTETAPVISCNAPNSINLRSVGKPFHGTEVRIAEDGEILIKGELVMQGYWNNDQATKDAMTEDGWLKTGDIGHLDARGMLYITDRKKDIIVNSGGDTISPQKIVDCLTQQPEIMQAAVFGNDKLPYLYAVLVAEVNGAPVGDLAAAVANANKLLPANERVRKFIEADKPFSIEDGTLTPTLKVRRHIIHKRYEEQLKKVVEKI